MIASNFYIYIREKKNNFNHPKKDEHYKFDPVILWCIILKCSWKQDWDLSNKSGKGNSETTFCNFPFTFQQAANKFNSILTIYKLLVH